MKIKMTLARSTKNTHRYEAANPLLPVVYIHKAMWPGATPPSHITVEITDGQ